MNENEFPELLNAASGSAQYAHETVRNAYDIVEHIEDEWKSLRFKESGGVEVRNIENIRDLIKLIGIEGFNPSRDNVSIMDSKRLYEIFRYFAATCVYSAAIIHSAITESDVKNYFKTEQDEEKKQLPASIPSTIPSKLALGTSFKHEITVATLDEIAGRILSEFSSTIKIGFPIIRAKTTSPGQIPFLQVSSTSQYQVFVRKGFELVKLRNSTARKVYDLQHDDLDHYPVLLYRSGQPHANSKIPQTLSEIIPDEDQREKLLKGKYITWIQIFLSDYESSKTQIEIDLIDDLVEEDPKTVQISPKRLFEIAGRERSGWNKDHSIIFNQEDVLVTYFSSVFLEYWMERIYDVRCNEMAVGERKMFGKRLQKWCNERIHSYAANIKQEQMYIGFDWGTIVDVGYNNKTSVCGSTGSLLLALTRGLVNLSKNSSKLNGIMGRKSKEYFYQDRTSWGSNFASFLEKQWCFNHHYTLARRQSEIIIDKKNNITSGVVYRNRLRGYMFGADSTGITIKSKPTFFIFTVMLSGVVVFVLYVVLMGIRQRRVDNIEEYVSGIIALPPLIVAVCLAIMKIKFPPNVELMDIINGRMRTESYSQLERFYFSDKDEAVRVLASVTNPKEIFTGVGSNVFVECGEGDFRVDQTFQVRELQLAGFIFGVDYNGKPIVLNCQGVSRKLKFPDTFDEENIREEPTVGTMYYPSSGSYDTEDDDISSDEEEALTGKDVIQIRTKHEIQPSYIYKIPITTTKIR